MAWHVFNMTYDSAIFDWMFFDIVIRFQKGAKRTWCRWHLDDCKSLFIFYSNFCANSSRAVKSIFAHKIYLSTMYHPVTENKVAFVLRLPLLYNCYLATKYPFVPAYIQKASFWTPKLPPLFGIFAKILRENVKSVKCGLPCRINIVISS